jgi:hypothetical protein
MAEQIEIRMGEDLIDRLATTGLPCHRIPFEIQAQRLEVRYDRHELFSVRAILEKELGETT